MRAPVKTNLPPGFSGSFKKEQDFPPERPIEEYETETIMEPAVPNNVGQADPEEVIKKHSKPDESEKSISDILKPEGVLDSLKSLGIEIDSTDLEKYLFYGFVEKTVPVMKLSDKKSFTVKIRTLTSKQYMAVEDMIGDRLRISDMTREGMGSYRTLAVLSLAVTELMGRTTTEGLVEAKLPSELRNKAYENLKIIEELSPGVVNKINLIHSTLTTAFNNMLDYGNSPFLTAY